MGAQTQAQRERMARELKATQPKQVENVFDVSGSMENYQVFAPLREAVVELLRNGGFKTGDHVVVTAFDTAPRVLYDEELRSEEDVESVIDALPGETSPDKTGTNIRHPHHLALQRAEKARAPWRFIILVSDSFNDTPSRSDPAWADYERDYALDSKGVGRLDVFPKTPLNSDYERLLRDSARNKTKTWGLGVEIVPTSGRPRERHPKVLEGRPDDGMIAPAVTQAPAKKEEPFPWWWLALAAAVLLAIIAWVRMNAPVHVSLAEGPKRFQNFTLRPREAITVGGSGARGYEHGYPIPGPAEPAAYIERGMRDFTLKPGEAVGKGEATLLLNNEEVKAPRAIGFADDLKVRVRRTGQEAAPQEHRLQFGRAIEDESA